MLSHHRVICLTLAVVVAAVLATVVVLDGSVGSLLTRDTSFPSVGTVKAVGVGVYWDNNCSSRVASIDWGLVEPSSVENVTVFIRNEGNAVVSLSLNATNWNPSNASDFIALSWDSGQIIEPNEVIQVVLRLSVAPSIKGITTFSFDIRITGSG